MYREVGLLEVFVTCLHRYATLLKDKQAAHDEGSGKCKADRIKLVEKLLIIHERTFLQSTKCVRDRNA